jgi:hypothetical protein
LLTLQSTGARFLRVRVALLVSAHGTRRHLINLNNWHATPQPAEVEIEFTSCDEVEMCDVNVMTNFLLMV